MIVYNQIEMKGFLAASFPKHYKKQGVFAFRIANEEELVITKIATESSPEIQNVARIGDYILTGAGWEQYIIKPDVFPKRYKDNGDGTATAIGECWGGQWVGENIVIEVPASWEKGTMPLNNGDYLVSPNEQITEVYRVEQSMFEHPTLGYTLVSTPV